jgi:hypothetical protein
VLPLRHRIEQRPLSEGGTLSEPSRTPDSPTIDLVVRMGDVVSRVRATIAAVASRPVGPVLFTLFVITRFLDIVLHPIPLSQREMVRVAFTFGSEGYLGNPYAALPTGVSAHVAPGYPIILGTLFALVGDPDRTVLYARYLVSVLVALQFALLPAVAVRCGLRREHGLIAALIALVPVVSWFETGATWETPWVSACLMLLLALTLPVVRSGALTVRRAVALGLLWGIGFHFQPVLLPVFLGLLGLTAVRWRRRGAAFVARFASTAVIVSLLVVTPYTLRNWQQLGGIVFIRDNFGLELAVSNNDVARPLLRDNMATGFKSHPTVNRAEATRVLQLGEIEYNRERAAEARNWILAHPRAFAVLTAKRAFYLWFAHSDSPLLQLMGWLVAVVALIGLGMLWRAAPLVAWCIATVLVSYLLIYLLVAYDFRYIYPSSWLKFLLVSVVVCGAPVASEKERYAPLTA